MKTTKKNRMLLIVLFAAILLFIPAWRQSVYAIADPAGSDTVGKKEIEAVPAEQKSVPLKVMIVVLITWLGLAAFLLRIDLRIRKLEKQLINRDNS